MAHGDPDGGPKISELTQSMVEAWKRWPAFFRFEALLPCQIPRTIQAPELSPFARPLAAEASAFQEFQEVSGTHRDVECRDV